MCEPISERVRVTRRRGCNPLVQVSLLVLVMALGVLVSAPAFAITLFSETFDNASGFPPGIDPRKYGVPVPPDADEPGWNSARFEGFFFGNPAYDVGIQEFGGGGNDTPVGFIEDDAGLYFEISTLGLTDVVLEFDWRTFSATNADRLRVGYLVGPSPVLKSNGSADFRSGSQAWSNWTELLEGKNNTFQSASYALPSNEENIIIAFWLDNGEHDFGKFDNVLVTAVPEPSTALLLAAGLGWMAARRRR